MQILNLENPFGGSRIYYRELTDSTMNDARSLISDNPPTGTVVLADEQTAGRGRVEGRKWIAARGQSLLFTALIRESDIGFNKTLFPLYAGYCVLTALDKHFGIEGKVKWPNDVLVGGRKISGILCENSDSYILCGIGLNLRQETFPLLEKNRGVSVFQLTGEECSPSDFLLKILSTVRDGLGNCEWAAVLEKRLYMKGENVLFCEGLPETGNHLEGVIKGIGAYGQLQIVDRLTGSVRDVYSGEILCN